MSPLIEYLINIMGWQGAMLTIAGLMLTCCLFGALFKPLPSLKVSLEYDSTDDVKEISEKTDLNLTIASSIIGEDEEVSEMSQSAPRLSLSHDKERNETKNCKPAKSLCSVTVYLNDVPIDKISKRRSQSFSPGFLYRKDTFYSGSLVNIPNYPADGESMYVKQQKTTNKKKVDCFLFRWLNCSDEIMDNLSEMIDLTLMRNSIFLIFSISNFLTSVGYHIPFIYLKVHLFD